MQYRDLMVMLGSYFALGPHFQSGPICSPYPTCKDLHQFSQCNMSAPYKQYISSAVCEGISKNGWPVVGVLFFLTSHQFIYFFFPISWVLWEKNNKYKNQVFMLGKTLEHRLYWNWVFSLTWALISGPQAFTLC